jgi:Domain of unknown function (DUF4349)
MPATETADFEREFEELVRDLRALPTAAPMQVRERVRVLGEPGQTPTFWDRLRSLSLRRSLLVLAPACAVGLVVAAVVHGIVSSGGQHRETLTTVQRGGALEGGAQHGASGADRTPPVYGTATTKSPFDLGLPGPTPGRYQDYEAWMTVRVKDLEGLTDQTNEAMRIVGSYGGYVASVEQSTTAGRPGESDLVLRVPVTHVQDALLQLSRLGTVVERHLSIRDLNRVVQQQRARILQLKLFIARASEALQGSLPADVRLRLQLQLDEARRNLTRATNAGKATLRAASLSRISLTLTTQKAVGVTKKHSEGRIERAARDAASFLAAAGAVLLFLLIVLSPVIVLVALGIWGARVYRTRMERRLLA